MFIRIKKTKLIYLFLLILLISSFNSSFAKADNKNIKEIDDTIDKQNELLYEKIFEQKKDQRNILEEAIKEAKRNDGKELSLSRLSKTIERGSIKLALLARKYIVPVSILVILFNIIMLSITGAKNLKNRKKYIWSSIFFYIFYLIILNFPIYLLWRYSIDAESMFSLKAFYNFVVAVTSFLKENSLILALIIFSYGIINYISSESNIPKRLASSFVVKMSLLLFVLFQILPVVIKLAV